VRSKSFVEVRLAGKAGKDVRRLISTSCIMMVAPNDVNPGAHCNLVLAAAGAPPEIITVGDPYEVVKARIIEKGV